MEEKKCIFHTHKNLIKEWDWIKNNELGLDPKKLTHGSNKKAWWICEKRHEWEATIVDRTRKRNCPYCAGKKACKDNCLSTIKPELSKSWHPTKNGNLTSKDITPGSQKKVWWICIKNHEWKETIVNRTKGRNCPYCSNKKVCKDNCLTTTNPEISKYWHPVKNGKLTPKDITSGSHKKIWWICQKNKSHEWRSQVYSKTIGHGCPVCSIENNSGKNNYNYNPDLTDEEREKNKSRTTDTLYKQWRNKIFKRDKYICQVCLQKGGSLNAHHIESWSTNKKLRLVESNGTTLCENCHKKFHKIYGKKNNDKKQLKKFISYLNFQKV